MAAKNYFDENNDQLGKYVRYEWDLYVYYKGNCVWEKSGVMGLNGIMMDYNKMESGEEGTFCKYNFYF